MKDGVNDGVNDLVYSGDGSIASAKVVMEKEDPSRSRGAYHLYAQLFLCRLFAD